MTQLGPYQCRYCVSSFDTKEHRENHETHRHKNDVIRSEMRHPTTACTVCSLPFLDDATLQRHSKQEHPETDKNLGTAPKRTRKSTYQPSSDGESVSQSSLNEYIEVISQSVSFEGLILILVSGRRSHSRSNRGLNTSIRLDATRRAFTPLHHITATTEPISC